MVLPLCFRVRQTSRDSHANVTYYFLIIGLSAAVGCGQRGGTLFQVPRLLSALGCAADGDGVDAVGVAIAGAVVPFSPTVSRRPDKNGAQALPALEGEENKTSASQARPRRVGLAPAWGPPF